MEGSSSSSAGREVVNAEVVRAVVGPADETTSPAPPAVVGVSAPPKVPDSKGLTEPKTSPVITGLWRLSTAAMVPRA